MKFFHKVSKQIYFLDIMSYFNLDSVQLSNVDIINLENSHPDLEKTFWIAPGEHKYLRKDGQPDKRYSKNPLLPDTAYLVISTDNRRYVLFSTNTKQMARLVSFISKMSNTVIKHLSNENKNP